MPSHDAANSLDQRLIWAGLTAILYHFIISATAHTEVGVMCWRMPPDSEAQHVFLFNVIHLLTLIFEFTAMVDDVRMPVSDG
jgi:hypothetical protein